MGLTDQREGPVSAGCGVPYGLRLAAVGEPSLLELPRVGIGDTDESEIPRCKSGAFWKMRGGCGAFLDLKRPHPSLALLDVLFRRREVLLGVV